MSSLKAGESNHESSREEKRSYEQSIMGNMLSLEQRCVQRP
jgi:hypothetical protein